MRAVIREGGGMVFHNQAVGRYLPRALKRGTDEVMLSVRAAAINPVDYKVWSISRLAAVFVCAFAHFNRDLISTYRHDFKVGKFVLGEVVGLDVAGVITEVAQNSTSPFKVGDEVFGICMGSLADRVRVSSSLIALKPKTVSFVEAAAMPVAYLTSLQGLRSLIFAHVNLLVLVF